MKTVVIIIHCFTCITTVFLKNRTTKLSQTCSTVRKLAISFWRTKFASGCLAIASKCPVKWVEKASLKMSSGAEHRNCSITCEPISWVTFSGKLKYQKMAQLLIGLDQQLGLLMKIRLKTKVLKLLQSRGKCIK